MWQTEKTEHSPKGILESHKKETEGAQKMMSLRVLFSDIDSKCLAFALVFFFAAYISLQLIEDWQTKLVISGLCMFFIFVAFALDALIAAREECLLSR